MIPSEREILAGAAFLAERHEATALGLDVKAPREELRSLRVAIATQAASFEEVRNRFRTWMA